VSLVRQSTWVRLVCSSSCWVRFDSHLYLQCNTKQHIYQRHFESSHLQRIQAQNKPSWSPAVDALFSLQTCKIQQTSQHFAASAVSLSHLMLSTHHLSSVNKLITAATTMPNAETHFCIYSHLDHTIHQKFLADNANVTKSISNQVLPAR